MHFTDCLVNTFLCDVFLKLCVCIRSKLRREVPFKLIFIRYNMEPFSFLVFLLTVRARGMRRRWKRRQTRRSPPSLPFTWLLTSLLSLSRWRTRLGRRGCVTMFPCFLRDLPLFGLESCWITLCCLLAPWEPSFSFSWTLLSHCTFLRLTSAIPYLRSVKASIVERGGCGSGLHFYIAMALGEYNSWSEQIFYEIKSGARYIEVSS